MSRGWQNGRMPEFVEPLEGRAYLSHHRHIPISLPRPDHVVIVVEENHSYDDIFGSGNPADTPYLHALAAQGATFTNSSAIGHPSQPNYLALYAGSTYGVSDDNYINPRAFRGPSLGGELVAKGLTFGGYSEDLPSVGFTGDTSGFYDKKHNPWSDFRDVRATVSQPFSNFPSSARLFNRLPTVSFVVPNELDNMHDGTPAQADAWLQANLDAYVQWAKTHNSLLIVTWDEDDASGSNQIPTLFVGPMVKPGQYGEAITHYNVLRTVEDMYGLGYAGVTARANPILDVWQ
jgi:phosphatidylinositol-3-phosphatase